MGVVASSIADNLRRVRERIASAAARAGRCEHEITIIAVSKTHSPAAIREAYEAGVRHFGENRVQEREGKHRLLADLDATWHLVGHLQSNKALRAVRLFHAIDSVDSIALAEKLDRAVIELAADSAGKERGPRLPILLEVRLAAEETKTGVEEAELPALAEVVLALPRLDLRGLMCIPPFFEDPEQARPYFRRLRELRDSLRARLSGCHSEPAAAGEESLLPELSMGMSHDFEIAIEEGATQIRLGTAVFGARGGK